MVSKKAIWLAMTLFLTVHCAGRQRTSGVNRMKEESTITAQAVQVSYQRPPLVEVVLDVRLRNSAAEARWFILPLSMPRRGEGGVNVLEAQACVGRGRAVMGRFLGRDGFYAFLLPAGGEVRLHRLPIEYWGDPPERLHLAVRTARELTLGGEPARAWFEADPTSDLQVEADGIERVSVHRTADGKEVPASLIDARELHIEIDVPR